MCSSDNFSPARISRLTCPWQLKIMPGHDQPFHGDRSAKRNGGGVPRPMGEIAKRRKGEGDQPEVHQPVIPAKAGIPVDKRNDCRPRTLSFPRKREPVWCPKAVVNVPSGYFSAFKESVGLAADLIKAGLPVNQHTIPDGSVGGTWGGIGLRTTLPNGMATESNTHTTTHPSIRSARDPQMANAYPNETWAGFQSWFRSVYLPTKYPAYILKKASMLPGGAGEARQLAAMYEPKAIEGR